ncbi:MAG: hypothetical protein JST84_05430 [Acidobacteria bacterium]|nr:hypothetical protein [Acidobacteriota bacterium]
MIESTFALIKPDAVRAGHVEAILQTAISYQLVVSAQQQMRLTEEQVRQLYKCVFRGYVNSHFAFGSPQSLVIPATGCYKPENENASPRPGILRVRKDHLHRRPHHSACADDPLLRVLPRLSAIHFARA